MFRRSICNCILKIRVLVRNGLISSANHMSPACGYDATRQLHDIISPSQVKGMDFLSDRRLNKGLGFSLEERQTLGIHGLQPPRYKSQEEQLELCKISINRYEQNLNKFLYLNDLHDRNERLFFRLLSENIENLMPIVYTPTVGLACQKFGLIYRRPRGLFITINDRGHVFDILMNWPEPNVRAICVTDGERILGLGDLGASGMGIPIGKLALYTALAGIKPHQCLPILIDVGTNNREQLEDPLYIGLRQKRVTGKEYTDLLDEFMDAVVKRYGQNTLIQFEDFGNFHAFELLDRYKDCYCTFNDDIQGTAAVAVGGLFTAGRLTKRKFSDNKIMFAGAGEAAIGIADLCVEANVAEGLSLANARNNIFMFDIDGLLTTTRKEGDLLGHKALYAKDLPPDKSLLNVITQQKPNILIGASAATGLFTREILQTMAKNNERPIIFALSNPTSKAECTSQQAYDATEGRVIFSSGSPFPPVEYNGKTYTPGQGNNAYIFPGMAFAIIATSAHHVPDEMFLIAAHELSNCVEQSDLDRGSVFPPLSKIKEVSMRIAICTAESAYTQEVASTYPEPTDKRKWLESLLYDYNYQSAMPRRWTWRKPKEIIKTREMKPTKLYK